MAADDPIDIYAGTDFYVPTFEVKIDGKKQGKDVVRDILQVSYKDDVESIDSFELTVNNWDAETRSFKYSDGDRFDPGAKLELWMGYFGKGAVRLMLNGEITSLRPSFPASGQPTLAVSGLNVLHRFRKEQGTYTYENKKDSEIAQEIGRRLGVTVKVNADAASAEVPNVYIMQYNQYDILFLMQRARAVGYDLVVVEDPAGKQPSLYFGPSADVHKVSYRLTYGKTLVQFQPTLTTAHQVGQVVVRGWDPVHKKAIEVTAKRDELKTGSQKSKKDEQALEEGFNERQEVLTAPPVRNEQEAKKLALATLERIAKDMVKGSGSVVGLPDLRAGTVLVIEGVGARFSGRYFVTGTTHTLGGGGYVTEFECRREEQRA
jgi:phage protein D